MVFPEDYKQSFTKYHAVNFLRPRSCDNAAAIIAAKAGKPLPDGSVLFVVYSAKLDANNNPVAGADGFYIPDKLVRYAASSGWM